MSENRRGALYINPSSGTSSQLIADQIEDAAKAAGIDFVPIAPGLDLAGDVRSRINRGEELFVAAGGDGTLNHVMQPIVTSDATLGIIPTGTFNHFARDFKIPLDWRQAFEVAVSGPSVEVDTGRVNGRYFLNNISFGIYPEVVEEREKLRGRGKWRAYRRGITAALRKYKHVALVVETSYRLEAIKTHMFLVSVNPYDLSRLGLLAPREKLESGRLSVYWLPHMARPKFVMAVARYFSGKIALGEDLRTLRAPELKVSSSHRKLKFGMDGELVEMSTPLLISIVPQSLRVRVTPELIAERHL